MKKIFKSSLCLLLALVISISFAACGDKKADNEKEARKTVENFYDAFCELNFNKMSKYVDKPEIFEEIKEQLDLDKIVNSLVSEEPMLSDYKKEFKNLLEKLINKFTDVLEYEINWVKKDGDNYIAEVETTVFEDDVADIIADAMNDAFSEQAMQDLLNKLIADGTITAEDSEDEVLEKIFDDFFDYADEIVDNIEFETKTDESVITISEIDGEFLIITDGDEFDSIF